jgi:SAM-dependent methyltransferase
MLAVIERSFTRDSVRTVLDFACGTGAQAIPLAQQKYEVTACDLSAEMLQIAQHNAADLPIHFVQGDMRSSLLGTFDAVITMFNTVGYLSRRDFQHALTTIRANVRDEHGVWLFDNTNLDAIRAGIFAEGRHIDTAGESHGTKFVRLFDRHIDKDSGLFTIQWETHVQQGIQPVESSTGIWHRQLYTCDELEQMVQEAGFRIRQYYDRSGKPFQKTQSFGVLAVAETQ